MKTTEAIREIQDNGYCVLREHLKPPLIASCRDAFWPVLKDYIDRHREESNRGPNRHFLALPFTTPCFAPGFFFDDEILSIVRGAMDDRIVADQWGCDTPVRGSEYQNLHVDYRNPLFPESPDLPLPAYMLVVSFGLVPITRENGPIEIVPGTHRLPRAEAFREVELGRLEIQPVLLNTGDVLIRHPWALHRGSPNKTDTPRPLLTIRYVRNWYVDASRDVNTVPRSVWESLTAEQQALMRFPVEP
jgi:ectoine hydroxylase-related dioxygenase (phytanoyl-CoA dioxygenase family)